MFVNRTALLRDNPPRLYYGVAVTDADGDGDLEFVVAGYNGRNKVIKWTGQDYQDVVQFELADNGRQAIGLAAADIDGDGQEEIYILNTDSFAGRTLLADRLFDMVDNRYVDLFELPNNQAALNLTAGRSVAAVDRIGNGQYGFFVANYGGAMRLYELDDDGNVIDVAREAGVARVTGGRGLLSLPLISDYMDIFAGNENGANFLFRNNGDGTYQEIAEEVGLLDPDEHMRGVAVLDIGNPRFGIVYGNWEGAHRLFMPSTDGKWDDVAPPSLATPSKIRTVIAADFNNDGYQEIFFNNIGQANRLFSGKSGDWLPVDIGDALEINGLGTGAAIADLDGDGRLELLIAHGESGLQPLSLYHVPPNDNHYLRVMPLTQFGAPARGAIVTLIAGNRTQRRAIDAGSGYLCQMEPVAHFGLGKIDSVEEIRIRWPDGTTATIQNPTVNQMLRVAYPI